MTIAQDLQNLHQSNSLVELYKLDCTRIGGSVYYFTPHFAEGGSVSFGGITYMSIPVKTDGWEISADGTQPRPTLEVSNVNKILLSAITSLGDLVNAEVTRIRTFENYLDGGSTPDSSVYMTPVDVYVIEQLLQLNNTSVKFQLSSYLDKFGTKLPRRQFTRSEFPGIGRNGGW